MTRRLYLLRHAKSSWDSPTLHDHDRPLAPRGIRACETMSLHLREQRIRPDLILCSTALRTRQTLAGVLSAWGDPAPPVEFRAEIYEASPAALEAVVRAIPERVGSAMLIAHQPGIGAFTLRIAGSGERLGDVEAKFPTAALATVEIPGVWETAGEGSGVLTGFVKPKELQSKEPPPADLPPT